MYRGIEGAQNDRFFFTVRPIFQGLNKYIADIQIRKEMKIRNEINQRQRKNT